MHVKDCKMQGTTLLIYEGEGGNIVIPDGVTEIGGYAFADCQSLTGICLPDSVTKIGSMAFFACENLTSFRIPSHAEIGNDAFFGCWGLKRRPMMFADGKLLYMPENSFLPSYHEVRKLVLEKDYTVRLDVDIKYDLTAQIFLLDLDPEGSAVYLRKNFSHIFKSLIFWNRMAEIRKIVESGKFLSKRNLDIYIKYAIKKQRHEIYLLLTELKQKNNWYREIDQKLKL